MHRSRTRLRSLVREGQSPVPDSQPLWTSVQTVGALQGAIEPRGLRLSASRRAKGGDSRAWVDLCEQGRKRVW